MAKKNVARNREKYFFLLLTTILFVGAVGQSDWVAEMEDAFATENEQPGMMCKPEASDKRIFCRYQSDERLSLSTLSHCLCTHIVLNTEIFQPVPVILKSLRSTDMNVKILASISLNTINLGNSSESLQKVINWLVDQSFDGIDLLVEKEHLDKFSWSKFLKFLKDISALLNEQLMPTRVLSITINRNILSILEDSQFTEMSSYVDYISSIPAPHTLEHDKEDYSDIMQKIGMTSKTEIMFNKLLIPISLLNSIQQVMGRSYTNESYPELCKYSNNQTSKEPNSTSKRSTLLKDQTLFENLKNQVQFASQNEIAGVDIWSLNDDDSHNTCGKNPFPLTNEISANLKGERKTFNSFTDLDIVLSTGESQLDEIQVLQEPNVDPEEIRKFKCERIGFYRHPSDCSKFYHCAEQRATTSQPSSRYAVFVYKCPSGLVYDELQGSCNWPSYSEPCQGSDELLPVPSKKFQCSIPGFHVDPEDCRWFYYCSDLGDGRLAAFEFLCPSHLLGFDEQELLCNWKWMVPTCTNSHYTEEEDAVTSTTYTETTNKLINTSEINDNRYFKILNGVNPLSSTWNTFPDIDNVQPLALNLNIENSNDSLKHRFPVNSFLSEDAVSNKNSSMGYNNVTKIREELIDNSEMNGTLNSVKNNKEKKYGTAYWHRSMVTNKSPDNHQRNRFDAFLERIHDLRLSNNTSESSKIIKSAEELKVDHKYAIGTVRKINLDLLQEGKDSSSESNNQGRSLGDSISSSYRFENTLNDHESTSKQNPYAQVKCSKLNNKNKVTEANESSFGCVGEVSLTVNINKEKENDKFILKPDQIKSSAIQESEQIAVVSNHAYNTSTSKLQRLQLKSPETGTLHDHSNSDIKSNENAEKFNTQGRIASIERNIFDIPQINANNAQPNLSTFQNGHGIYATKENASDEKLLFEKNNNNNTEHDLSRNGRTDKVTLVRVPRTKHLQNSVKEKNNLMPLIFFPEGVLLNVDLNQINEIPPQILLEVDNMLKKYMNDGNIDIKVLMQKLNATAEPMSNMGNRNEITNNELDEMLGVLENLLNSTDSVNGNHRHNITITNPVTDNSNSTFIPSTTENYTDQNDLQLQYENTTNIIEPSEVIKETEKSINNTEAFNSASKNNSNMPGIKKIAEKIINVPENKPFVRRRLFRKHKFPSIREQLEFQSRSAYNRNLENPSYSTTTTTEKSVHIPNRHRYPSIQQQLLLNNKRKSLNTRNNVIWKRLEEMNSEVVANYNNTHDSNSSVQPSKSNNRDDIRLKDHQFENREPTLNPHPLRDREILLKAKLPNNNILLTPHQLSSSDTQSKTHQFGDRIKPIELDLSFNLNPRTPTFVLESPNHRNQTLENRKDSSFVSSDGSNPKFSDESIIVTMDVTSNNDLENENTPSIHNDIHSYRKPLPEESFKYTLPLSPLHRSSYHPIPQSTTPISDTYHLHRDSSESTVGEYPNIDLETAKRPRKSRKLRILVKKRFHNTQTNGGTNSATTHGDASKLDHHQHMRMRIPKKLLNELKSNVLRKIALNGKSEVKLQIQFQDHVWNVPFVNEKSSVDISPVACTRPGLFQHPKDCNMFYECFWDKWLQRFTLHVFSCPVRLVYDDSIRGCSRPSFESHCRNSLDNS